MAGVSVVPPGVAGGGAPLAADSLAGQFAADQLTAGQGTLPRVLAQSAAAATGTNQTLRLTYFTAARSFVSTQVAVYSGGTAAAATPTLVRLGLYSVAANGDLTLVASTANDTALFAAAQTAYTKAWSASVQLVAGQRYARGDLVVTAATAPTYPGLSVHGGSATATAVAGAAPRLTGAVTGQADLPASVAAASVAATTNGMIYSVILP